MSWPQVLALVIPGGIGLTTATWVLANAIGNLKVEVRELAQAFRDHLEEHPTPSPRLHPRPIQRGGRQ